MTECLLVDLGSTPLANAYLSDTDLEQPEVWYPLKVLLCHECHLAQTQYAISAREVFAEDYAYLSSTSTSWLNHAQNFVDEVIEEFDLDSKSFVVEVASNDGYLLANFVDRGIRTLGIEPSRVASEIARGKGVPTINEFMDLGQAQQILESFGPADLVIANNVLAHVPYPQEMLQALAKLVSPVGIVICEFAYLPELVRRCQFDTIYHEHYSYLSLRAVESIAKTADLSVINAQPLTTHGGSLRVSLVPKDSPRAAEPNAKLLKIRQKEIDMKLESALKRQHFQNVRRRQGNDLLRFLLELQNAGKQVAAYGAAAKGNTMLNVFGVKAPLISFVTERSATKVGKYLPGSRIPIRDESALKVLRPDYVLILPWNLSSEIREQLAYIQDWGGKFVVASPQLEIL